MQTATLDFDWSDAPNLIKVIVPFAKALLRAFNAERDYEVLKRRFGLEGSRNYTLQDIGDYYGISRERVRQMEERATRRIWEAFTGSLNLPELPVPDSIQQETTALIRELKLKGKILTEREITSTLQARYSIDVLPQDSGALRLLLDVFRFDTLPEVVKGSNIALHPSWITTTEFDKKTFYETICAIYRILESSVIPVSFFDLKIGFRRATKKDLDTEQFQYAVKVCAEFEFAGDESYQIKFEHLSSVADKAYRILYESKSPMHLNQILKEINHRLIKAGEPQVLLRTMQQQLVNDKRFVPIGRSGNWGLSEWKGIYTDTILNLMKNFFYFNKKSASLDEVYEYVSSWRPDVARNSVLTYLTLRKDIFVRVSETDYELAEWGSRPYAPERSGKKRIKKKTLRDIVQDHIAEYLSKQPDKKALVSDVAQHVMRETKCRKPTFYNYLSDMKTVQKERGEDGLYCYLPASVENTKLSFPQVEQLADNTLKSNLYRAIKNLDVENVDIGLFYLGKIFETELKAFLLEARNRKAFTVTDKDLEKLVSMIDCIERNGFIKEKHVLTFLRQERNERAHGEIPSLSERQRLMEQAPSIAELFVNYIIMLNKKRHELAVT